MIRVYLTEWRDGDPKDSTAIGYVHIASMGPVKGSSTPAKETHMAEFRSADGTFLGRVEFDVKVAESKLRILSAALSAAKKQGLI